MLVEDIMPRAQARLIIASANASVVEAAALMRPREADLIVVCSDPGAVGVVTKTDIVKLVGRGATDLRCPVSAIMSHAVVSCRLADRLADVWAAMSSRGVHRIPILEGGRPIGVVYARDALQALLQDAEHEDEALRAYVQGVGYH